MIQANQRNHEGKQKKLWSKKIIQAEIRKIYNTGQPLICRDIINSNKKLVRAAQKKRYFGSWRVAVKSIGINYNKYEKLYKKKKCLLYCDIKNGRYGKTLMAWQKHLALRGYHRLTVRLRLKVVKRFIDKYLKLKPIASMNHSSAKKYLCSRGIRSYSPKTMENIIVSLTQYFDFCVQKGIVKTNPFAEIKSPKYEKRNTPVLNEQELRTAVNAIEGLPISDVAKARGRLIIELIIYCGLRRREVVSLKRQDVNLDELTIRVKQGKHRKDRLLPINEALAVTINKYLALRGKNYSRYLLSNKNNNHKLNDTQMHCFFRLLSKQSGIKNITPHLLRGTLATLLFSRGAPIRSIQEIMGHSQVSTTANYIRVSLDCLRKEMSKHPLLAAEPNDKNP